MTTPSGPIGGRWEFEVEQRVLCRIMRESDTAQGNRLRINPGMPGKIISRTADAINGRNKFKVKFSDAILVTDRTKTMVLNLNGLTTEDIEAVPAPAMPSPVPAMFPPPQPQALRRSGDIEQGGYAPHFLQQDPSAPSAPPMASPPGGPVHVSQHPMSAFAGAAPYVPAQALQVGGKQLPTLLQSADDDYGKDGDVNYGWSDRNDLAKPLDQPEM